MDKEKEMRDIVMLVCDRLILNDEVCEECNHNCRSWDIAERIHEHGYRKADEERKEFDDTYVEYLKKEVKKETAKEIYDYIKNDIFPLLENVSDYAEIVENCINRLFCEKYGVEVEE